MAIVSLGDQRISIYGADGKLLDAPVSSGSAGYETPAGIFSIVQKKEEHRSNLYDDGEMPFMQRITWTGIALHAGNLPGHPASHGCVRLPMAFARQLFDMTEMGMRGLIGRADRAGRHGAERHLPSGPVQADAGAARAGPGGTEGRQARGGGGGRRDRAGFRTAPAGVAVDRHRQGRRDGAGRKAPARGASGG